MGQRVPIQYINIKSNYIQLRIICCYIPGSFVNAIASFFEAENNQVIEFLK